jgi:glutathione S-transferase
VSGQELVPVLIESGRVVADSNAILRYLEETHPEQPLWPLAPSRRAELDVFLDWFNRVWKRPPNEIEAELAKPEPDEALISQLGAQVTAALDLFEALLDRRDYLYGEFSAADCAAFPFLRYAVDTNEADDEAFHQVLRDFQPLGDHRHPRLEAWIGRVDALPRG